MAEFILNNTWIEAVLIIITIGMAVTCLNEEHRKQYVISFFICLFVSSTYAIVIFKYAGLSNLLSNLSK